MNEKIFKKNNPNVYINAYGLEKYFEKPQKLTIYPRNVVKEEKTDHFDLLLITENENIAYVCSQITLHEHSCYECYLLQPLIINRININ